MRKNHWVLLLTLGLIFGFIVSSNWMIDRRKGDFTLGKIRSPFSLDSKWAIDPLPDPEKEEISQILSQEFNYLGSGAECYAFLSADGNYVLKFFKTKHLVPKNWLKLFPLPGLEKYRFNKIDKRILRREQLFSNYKMAYEELKEETGLVYVHLNKSKDLKMKIRLFDRMRKCFILNLDEYEFVLQKKGLLIQDKIIGQMQKGNREGALQTIYALLRHVVHQCQKGFIDRDSGINHNYGFVGKQVIHFDVGRIIKDEAAANPAYYQREVLRIGKKLENWLSVHYPSLIPDLEEAINAMIDLDSQN